MSLIAIASIYYNNMTHGYRLLDTQTGEIKDTSVDSVEYAMFYKNVKIDNIKVSGDVLLGVNGSLDRLPKVWDGQLVSKNSPIIILNQIEDIGYTVTDYKGTIKKCRTADVIRYAEQFGIANGKLVTRQGETYISPIEGTYKKVNYIDNEAQMRIERMNLKAQTMGLPFKIGDYGELVIVDRKLTEIIVTETITKIDAETFKNCINLRKVKLPNTIKSIEAGAFSGCVQLSEVNIPNGITEIEQRVFETCSSLEHITLPESINAIGYKAFEGCKSLRNIQIPNNVTKIGANAFAISGLIHISTPEKLEELGEAAFIECNQLKSVDMTNSIINTIKDRTFKNNQQLQEVMMPNNIETIGSYAFASCRSLRAVNFPNKLKTIGNNAFLLCESIKEIKIPDTVCSVGSSAFYGCTSLTRVKIPNTLERINDCVFKHCKALRKVIFPTKLKCIESAGFFGCTSLQHIIIPQSVTTISKEAFKMCTSLKEIDLPCNKGLYMYKDALNDCDELRIIKAHPDTNLRRLEILGYYDNIVLERYNV